MHRTRSIVFGLRALSKSDLLGPDDKLEIWIEKTDPKARTLTISDNGIGMSREEVISNIGTIASPVRVNFFRVSRKAGIGHSHNFDRAVRCRLLFRIHGC